MKNKKIRSVLILGSGALRIGQAGEFDYSASQCLKALKEEGIRRILVNPNIATIQTSRDMAERIYFLPVTPGFVAKVIEKEKPDGIMLGFGGQTALNCGVDLHKQGILERHNVQILGTPISSIITSEDKGLFAKALAKIGVKTPKSIAVTDIREGVAAARKIGFPLIIRAGYALGGLGSGFCNNLKELKENLGEAIAYSGQVLVEESLKGWKEVEYEVMRDSQNNCMTVCNMENFDPLGIHTGESIVVAPSQTLTDSEYHKLRTISIKVIRSLGIIGECNVQFALDPDSEDYRVIEVNARLSRSSALASKATGYPLAFIAAKLGLGYSLVDLPNPVTKVTKAFFEPALDYIVVKFPRWDTTKFRNVKKEIGSSMKSVGEVMSIGRKFEEALQKAVRMVKPQLSGLNPADFTFRDIEKELRQPTDRRIFALMDALEQGYSVDELFSLTRIDRWFLYKLRNISQMEKELKTYRDNLAKLPDDLLIAAKQQGFSDQQIARHIIGDSGYDSQMKIRRFRKKKRITPVTKQIDTLAGEYPAQTNYLYLTYNASYDDIEVRPQQRGMIVLGGGPYSIGSSVEFDWCCVECVKTLRRNQIPSVVINYNPETVSTDYDECDRLYFDELTTERVLDIHDKEDEAGVIISMGGQIPNNLALPLHKSGINILGTDPNIIDRVEDRHKFSRILDELGLDQPEWKEMSDFEDIRRFSARVGYPLLIRPSYVLSGAGMFVAHNEEDLIEYIGKAADVSKEHPVVVTKFITDAKEIDMDIVAQEGQIKAYAISEHIENAGVHSGDATLVTPAQKLYLETVSRIKKISRKLIQHLQITGPVNIQFIAKDNNIKIIECNLRASRSFPFHSKVYGINFITMATEAIIGKKIRKVNSNAFDLDYLGVKAPQFSFTRLKGADPNLGVEMSSTGEVACLGETLEEAFLKSMLSAGSRIPKGSVLLSTGDPKNKALLLESVKKLDQLGFMLYSTRGTRDFYEMHGIRTNLLHWPSEKRLPNVLDHIRKSRIDLVINIPKNNERQELSNDYLIRRTAADFQTTLITNANCSHLFFRSLFAHSEDSLEVKAWQDYIEE